MRIFQPRRILVPIDFSPISPGVLQAGVDIAQKWEAEVVALHVARESDYVPHSAYESPFPPLAHDGARTGQLSKFREDTRARLTYQLEDMLRQAGGGRKCKALLLWGEPAKDIIQMAGSGGFDLIVMATHGRTGLNRVFVGSVTEEVLRHAPCPVFAIRIKEGRVVQAGREEEEFALPLV
ncbi:MAG: universal stress protein [Candidatus Tectomicrobia bacterium]|uniref:Universal stress protein n=1 Tax=Tectimicrobiota bacterium TaxID=2528274 RepID=A0A932MN70_UNCTE|nr:universal stress protein [Candidatus Tectomicrobia bacterium]